MLKEVKCDYYDFLFQYLINPNKVLTCKEDPEWRSKSYYMDDKEVLKTSEYLSRPFSCPITYHYYVDDEYLAESFITLFEETGKSHLIKTYFVCYYDNETKQLGNDVVKLYEGIKDKNTLLRLINKLGNKVVLNYKEI